MSDTEKIESILLSTTRPMSASELEEAAGLKPHCAYWPIGRLRKKYGSKLVETKAGKRSVFRIVLNDEGKTASRVRFKAPEDMWRGWVNPATGIVPERLGV